MISKNKQSRLAGFRILLAIPTAFALLLMFSFTSLEKTTSLLKTEILKPTIQAVQSSIDNLQTPQQKPVQKKSVKKIIKDTPPPFIKSVDTALVKKQFDANYPGGYKAWMNFFIHNFKPAPDGGFKGAQYRAYIQFVVAENGEVKSPTVINGMSKSWDSEAVRIVLMMPNWKPILKDGKPVRTQFILPIEGRLEAPKNITYVAGSQPEYKGGYDALRQYIRENTHYPESAKKLKIQGTVWVAAFINTDGKISKVELLKGIKGGCNEEALRVIKEMPDWAPGSDKTQKPICRYLTVSFNPKTIKKS